MINVIIPSEEYSYVNDANKKALIGSSCPLPTKDLELNTKNRNRAIQSDYIKYGPLNVDAPSGYWDDIAKHWNTSVESAKKSLCGNCVAFDISPRMKECMPVGSVSDKSGEIGYCWMHNFKCHSARTCYTWAKGGAITSDKISYEWQDKNQDSSSNAEGKKEEPNSKLMKTLLLIGGGIVAIGFIGYLIKKFKKK
jgi:hypothetical protein